jgi:Uma2 family endonuclease
MVSTVEKQTPKYSGMHVSREEYLDLEEDGFRYDMIEGVLHLSPSPEFEHSSRSGNLFYKIKSYLQERKIAHIVFETDVFLPDKKDVVRPDISVILNENMNIVKKHIHGSPDLVAEVLSPSTRNRDLGIKAERYLSCGVKEYWIVDPENSKIHLWRNLGNEWKKESGDELVSSVLQGLVIVKKEIFE